MIRRGKAQEAACLAEFDPPFIETQPEVWRSPVIFSSPHSGRHYPADFLARSDQPLNRLRRNEDAFIDILFAPAPKLGAPLIAAQFPRCFLDVSRAHDELPPKWLPAGQATTQRAESGLGVVPSMLTENCPIYRRPLKPVHIKKRLEALYHPYHSALQSLLTDCEQRFGEALLVDCHSMPGFAPSGARRADIILGDRYGISCHPETIAAIDALFTKFGYSVARNHPYAGGYITAHYGDPMSGTEAIQIEINRDLYLNPITLKLKSGFDDLAADLVSIMGELLAMRRPAALMAAEYDLLLHSYNEKGPQKMRPVQRGGITKTLASVNLHMGSVLKNSRV